MSNNKEILPSWHDWIHEDEAGTYCAQCGVQIGPDRHDEICSHIYGKHDGRKINDLETHQRKIAAQHIHESLRRGIRQALDDCDKEVLKEMERDLVRIVWEALAEIMKERSGG